MVVLYDGLVLQDHNARCLMYVLDRKLSHSYLSLAGVCVLYWFLQQNMGKKVAEGEDGYEDDHGYLPPIDESGVDDMFETWWDPAEAAAAEALGGKNDDTHRNNEDKDASADDDEEVGGEESSDEMSA